MGVDGMGIYGLLVGAHGTAHLITREDTIDLRSDLCAFLKIPTSPRSVSYLIP